MQPGSYRLSRGLCCPLGASPSSHGHGHMLGRVCAHANAPQGLGGEKEVGLGKRKFVNAPRLEMLLGNPLKVAGVWHIAVLCCSRSHEDLFSKANKSDQCEVF